MNGPQVTIHNNTATSSLGGLSMPFKGPYYTIEQFLKLQDKDLQCYLFIGGDVQREFDKEFKIDNEEKIGYYVKRVRLMQNKGGTFFCQSRIMEWIVYNRKTKRMSMSNGNGRCFTSLMRDNFRYPQILQRFIRKPTKTLCKNIMLGKISTLEDLLVYTRTYSVRCKNVSLPVLYSLLLKGKSFYLRLIEDPENLTDEHVEKLNTVNFPTNCNSITFKTSEIEHANERFKSWYEQQGQRVRLLRGQRADQLGNPALQDAEF